MVIADRRKALQLDQKALGELSGVAVHTISNVENGIGNPGIKTISRMLKPLGLTMDVVVRQNTFLNTDEWP